MGKGLYLWIAILVVLMTSLVLAGNSYDLDFDSGPTQAIYLIEGGEVRFELLGDQHSLIMESVGSTSVKLDFAPFLNDGDSSMFSGLLLLDTTMKLDLDKDGIADLNVALYSVSDEYVAHIVLQDASASASDLVTGLVTGDENSEDSSLSNYVLGGVGVAIVLLLAFLFFREKGEAKEEKKSKAEVKEDKADDFEDDDSEDDDSEDDDLGDDGSEDDDPEEDNLDDDDDDE